MGKELGLHVLGALHGVDDGRKIDQERIAEGLDDLAMMDSDGLFHHLIMHSQQPQCTCFVSAHLAAETHDVREHDRRELAGFGLPWPSLAHHDAYFAPA
jgi:hypothetical protein